MEKRAIIVLIALVLIACAIAYAFLTGEGYVDIGVAQAPLSGPMQVHGAFVSSEPASSEVEENLRREKGLRRLAAIEAIRSSNRLPAGTYFFLPTEHLASDVPTLVSNGKPMERYDGEGLFEIHKYSEWRYALIGYASGDAYFAIRELDGSDTKDISLVPEYAAESDHIIQVPLHRIAASAYKDGVLTVTLR